MSSFVGGPSLSGRLVPGPTEESNPWGARKGRLRGHCAIVQPRLYDSAVATSSLYIYMRVLLAGLCDLRYILIILIISKKNRPNRVYTSLHDERLLVGTLAVLGLIDHHVDPCIHYRPRRFSTRSDGPPISWNMSPLPCLEELQPRTVSTVHERLYHSLLRDSNGLHWPRT
jgi:hypothetical protein